MRKLGIDYGDARVGIAITDGLNITVQGLETIQRNNSDKVVLKRIDELLELGYRYVIYTLNGYGGKLNEGDIVCGYQNKNNLNTSAWDPKNIEFKINVISNSCAYIGFAIDLKTKVDFMTTQSYGDGFSTSGNVEVVNDIKGSLEGYDVLVVDDITDSALTMDYVLRHLKEKNPKRKTPS